MAAFSEYMAALRKQSVIDLTGREIVYWSTVQLPSTQHVPAWAAPPHYSTTVLRRLKTACINLNTGSIQFCPPFSCQSFPSIPVPCQLTVSSKYMPQVHMLCAYLERAVQVSAWKMNTRTIIVRMYVSHNGL